MARQPDQTPSDKPEAKPTETPSERMIPRPASIRRSNLQVIMERLGDTILDAKIHYTRLFSERLPPIRKGPRVVVLGTGWAAHSLVKIIDVSATKSVTVVSPRNFFFFTPLLSATAVGTIEFRSIVEPIRKANPFIDHFEAFAVDVDVESRVVRCVQGQRDGERQENAIEFDVPYDILVVAVGETTATFNVPGAREHANFLKEITDARLLRRKLLDCLERASLPVWSAEERRDMLHFVVVGGGATGCEFAGELSDFVSRDLAPRYGEELVSEIEVTLLQSGKSLLTQFESSLQERALSSFSGRVSVRFSARVSKVTDKEVLLQNGDCIRYGLLIWAAGNETRPIVKRLLSKLGSDMQGSRKLPVDPWFRVLGLRNVFALGDCAEMDSERLPSTAQVAGQQGAFLGRMLSKAEIADLSDEGAPRLRDSGGRYIQPFRFLSLGIMAYLGNDTAVVQVEAAPNKNVKIGGRVAYALWRSVYAVKQVDVRNRVLVLFDYFKSRVYGRDISQF